MAEEETDDLSRDPDEDVDDDEMSPAEGGYKRGADRSVGSEEEESSEDDEVK